MTFDDEINPVFDTISARLRTEIARQVQAAIEELSAQALIDRERAASDARAASALVARDDVAAAVAAAEAREAAAVAAAEARDRDHAAAEARQAAALAAAEAREAATLAASESRAREHAVTEARQAAAVAAAEAREAAAVAAAEARARDLAIAEARQAAAEAEARQAAAVLAAEARSRDHASSPSLDASTITRLRDGVRAITRARTLTDTLMALVTRAAFEAPRVALVLASGGRLDLWRQAGFPPQTRPVAPTNWGIVAQALQENAVMIGGPSAGMAAPVFAGLPDGRASVAVPIALCGSVVAVLYADQGTADDASALSSQVRADSIELLARSAAVSLEAITAFATARALLGPREGAPSAGTDATIADATADATTADSAAAARRYARLLVSEIKLYHEADVVAGRRDHDLAARLGQEIARARALYEQRAPAAAVLGADYFHDELVRTLANGDPTLLDSGM